MAMPAAKIHERQRLPVHRDLRSVRELLRRIRDNQGLAYLHLFGRRTPIGIQYDERRDRDRVPVLAEMPIYVTPAAFDGSLVEPLEGGGGVIFADAMDVSLRGLGFTHDDPFLADYAIVTFCEYWVDANCPKHSWRTGGEDSVSLLLEIRWSNVERDDSYMSGGKFLGITETPGF